MTKKIIFQLIKLKFILQVRINNTFMKVCVLCMDRYLYSCIHFKLSYNDIKSHYYINSRKNSNNK